MRSTKIHRFVTAAACAAVLGAVIPILAGASVPTPALGYDPLIDGGSMSLVSTVVGAQEMWQKGYTGKGVDVAVIDTGVSRVPGLNGSGKVIDGADLSFDSQNPLFAHLDGFGHGTMMASIIAGSDAVGTSKTCGACLVASPYSDTTKFVGIAPGARIINVKAGAFDGSTDVSQVIAAIDWVVQHRTQNGMNIRVINLSYGTDSVQEFGIDPLAYAAEVAWRKGIVVVASAGNEGLKTPSLASPAYNPNILAVGASDTKGTVTLADDFIPTFAQHGSALRHVDVVAPGAHIIGLKVPGSTIDSSVTTGKVGTRFQRGSGTSEATAVVSGVVALLLQKYPSATPDQIKTLLTTTAQPTASTESVPPELMVLADRFLQWWQGNGVVRADQAAGQALPVVEALPFTSRGTGTLEGARGSTHVISNGVSLTGEKDILSAPWDGMRWSAAAWAGTSWSGGSWNGMRWSGSSWLTRTWATTIWTGSDWSGMRWSGMRWSAMSWLGMRWSGLGWDGMRWSTGSWDGMRWSDSSWE